MSEPRLLFYSTNADNDSCFTIYHDPTDGQVHVEYIDGASYVDFACSETMSDAIREDLKKLSGK